MDGYRIRIVFTDGTEKIVDFSEFITGNNKEVLAKYKAFRQFTKFKIEEGNIVWGKD